MFYHQSMATQGLWAEFLSPRSIANLGHYETEVIITPVIQTGGGGYVPSFRGKPDRYEVRVRVRIGDRWYEEVAIVSDDKARVSAQLHGITEFKNDTIMVSVNGVQQHTAENVTVSVIRD